MKNTLAGGLKLTTDEYLDTEETNRPFELVWGVVREPPSPRWDHQTIVLRLVTALDQHVRQLGIGKVGVAPLDVVLDAEKHLILQPDVLVILADRTDIIDRQVWGPPDLVVEVLSLGSMSYDRRDKRRWYGKYGVREQWIVDPVSRAIDVINLAAPRPTARTFGEDEAIESVVLPALRLRVATVFEE
jgi:Uma2 family endonuclease